MKLLAELTDEELREEMEAAGLEAVDAARRSTSNGDALPGATNGTLPGWRMTRAWRYWIVRAEEGYRLNKSAAQEAWGIAHSRPEGYAGGYPNPGRGILCHVDTVGALVELAKILCRGTVEGVPLSEKTWEKKK